MKMMTKEELMALDKAKLVQMIFDLIKNKGVCEAQGECGGDGEEKPMGGNCKSGGNCTGGAGSCKN